MSDKGSGKYVTLVSVIKSLRVSAFEKFQGADCRVLRIMESQAFCHRHHPSSVI